MAQHGRPPQQLPGPRPPLGEGSLPRARPVLFWLAVVGFVLAAVAAYHNSFSTSFVFDDARAIQGTRSIRGLGA